MWREAPDQVPWVSRSSWGLLILDQTFWLDFAIEA